MNHFLGRLPQYVRDIFTIVEAFRRKFFTPYALKSVIQSFCHQKTSFTSTLRTCDTFIHIVPFYPTVPFSPKQWEKFDCLQNVPCKQNKTKATKLKLPCNAASYRDNSLWKNQSLGFMQQIGVAGILEVIFFFVFYVVMFTR